MREVGAKQPRKVQLSETMLTYIASAEFLPPELNQVIGAAAERNKECILDLDNDTAERLRDEFTLRLARVGFDDEYRPTPEGLILEELIDRFAN